MAWYDIKNNSCGYVLWSRTRLYRNIDKLPFPFACDEKKLQPYIDEAAKILKANGFHIPERCGVYSDLANAELMYIPSSFLMREGQKEIFLNEPCNLCVSVGGEDMFTIESLMSGNSLDETFISAIECEGLLDESFDMAYSEKLGYLSPNIYHLYHGLELSCALFLPAISKLDGMKRVIRRAEMQNIRIFPFTTYENNPGSIYVITYIPSLYDSIYDAKDKLLDFIKYVISLEKEYSDNVFTNKNAVANKAWRSFGIMQYSSMCTEAEMLTYIASLRLMLCRSLLSSSPYLIEMTDLDKLQYECMTSYICAFQNNTYTCDEDVSRERAKILNSFVRSLKSNAS